MREATVYFSTLVWPTGEATRHFCENCYRKVEAERTAFYVPKRKPLPFIDVERITASDYLTFAAKAHANTEDAPAYGHLLLKLKRFPAARERLATEMLRMACESLEKGKDAWNLVGLGSCFGNLVPAAKIQPLVQSLERIVLRSVELMAQAPNPPASRPFGFGLTIAANALRRYDPAGFSTLLEGLKAQQHDSPQMRAAVDYLEREMAESEMPPRRKRANGE